MVIKNLTRRNLSERQLNYLFKFLPHNILNAKLSVVLILRFILIIEHNF